MNNSLTDARDTMLRIGTMTSDLEIHRLVYEHIATLERWHRVALERESDIIDLEREVHDLLRRLDEAETEMRGMEIEVESASIDSVWMSNVASDISALQQGVARLGALVEVVDSNG